MWQSGAYGYLLDYLLWVFVPLSLSANAWLLFRAWPRDRRPRARLIAGNAAIGLALLACVGLAGETYLRFFSTSTDALGVTLTCKRWRQAYARLNSLYCRDQEWPEQKPPGVRRIAFVGDSFTYGWGIDDTRDRFTELLQERFRREQRAVQVMNVAWAAWDTQKQLAFVRDYLEPYEIDEIVLCHVPNDLEGLIPAPPGADPRQAPKSWIVNVESSFLLDWIYHRIIAPRILARYDYSNWLAAGYANASVWDKQKAVFAELAAWCRERGILLRVALMPFVLEESTDFDSAAVQARVRGAFTELGVEFVDLLPAISREDPDALILGRHDPHPNEEAHRIFADAIWAAFYAGGR